MQIVIDRIDHHKRRIAAHPFYAWLRAGAAPLARRFDFAPVLVNFIMGFSDMNKWFMRYPSPADERERAINKHTREDETHSRLFIEDWRKLGLDGRLGWTAGETLAWYHAAPRTEAIRAHGIAIMTMLTRDEDPLVRFALMESIEAWGHVMFAASAEAASALSRETGAEYRYFGPYHLKRELGHLLAGGRLFEAATLDEPRRARALALVDAFFAIAEDESERMLRYAEGAPEVPPFAAQDECTESQQAATAAPIGEAHVHLQRVLDERRAAVADHPLFTWIRSGQGMDAAARLRRIALFWAPDCLGYRDLNVHALTYADPDGPAEQAINRWTAALATHHALFLRDWQALQMDRRLGFTASDTLEFYCRSEHSEIQRHSMASFLELAVRAPDAASRYWLLAALEASGEAFFAATAALAADVEAEEAVRLDYFADRHGPADPTAARVCTTLPMTPAQADAAAAAIATVFECLEHQLTASLEQALAGRFLSD